MLLVSLGTLVLSSFLPGAASAQSAGHWSAAHWEVGPPPRAQVQLSARRGPDGEPLAVVEPEPDEGSFAPLFLLTLGAGMTAGAAVGLTVLGTELPSYAGQWRGDAIAGLSASTLLSSLGPILLGAGLALGAEGDALGGVAVAAMLQYLSAAILGISAIVIAPGVGDDWEDRALQADTAMMLGLESLALGMGAIVGATFLILMEEPPEAIPLVSASVSHEGATLSVSGHF